jgi:hypothetical protein
MFISLLNAKPATVVQETESTTLNTEIINRNNKKDVVFSDAVNFSKNLGLI